MCAYVAACLVVIVTFVVTNSCCNESFIVSEGLTFRPGSTQLAWDIREPVLDGGKRPNEILLADSGRDLHFVHS